MQGRVDILAFMIWNNDRVIAALKKEGVDMDAPVEADGGRRRQVFLNVFRSEVPYPTLPPTPYPTYPTYPTQG
jgi:hypothetical protein